jgi:hypothetical protein
MLRSRKMPGRAAVIVTAPVPVVRVRPSLGAAGAPGVICPELVEAVGAGDDAGALDGAVGAGVLCADGAELDDHGAGGATPGAHGAVGATCAHAIAGIIAAPRKEAASLRREESTWALSRRSPERA